MSVQDLIFVRVSDGQTIYDPQAVTGTPIQIQVSNLGDDNLSDLGMYVVAATNVGDVDNPADYPPETDYQDVLTWGTKSDLGLAVSGGIKLALPQNSGSFSGYVTRSLGATHRTKIPFIDLAAGDTATFDVEFETPPGVPARRFFIDLVLE